MSLKRNTYWWIKNENGKLNQFGREKSIGLLVDVGVPNLFYSKRKCKTMCRVDETPVKVKLSEVK